jgi:heptaprenyl diphosphate synthase
VVNLGSLLNLPQLEENLNRVENALLGSVNSEDPFLTEVAGHLVRAGGKRLRPALAVAAAGTVQTDISDDVIRGGVSVELVHLGSLYHDDVMDEATIRRGVESVNARWGNLVAIVAGDFLLARASELAAGLGTEVAQLLAATIGRLCEGQVTELRTAYDVTRSEEAYLASIAGKTAALMAASARIGALAAGADRADIDALTAFGQAFGMVFQMVDDVLDVVGTEESLGKPAGHDLVEGVYTLPTIRALAEPDAGGDLRAILGRPLEEPERDKARSIVRSSDGVASTLDAARRWADKAANAVSHLGKAGAELAPLGHRLLDTVPLAR